MSQLVADEKMRAKLTSMAGDFEVVDEGGKAIGFFFPIRSDEGLAARSPFSREEIERRRREPGGFTFEEVMKSLEGR